MSTCACGRRSAIFYCKNKNCPYKEKQNTYCMLCSEEGHHDHEEIGVAEEVHEQYGKWIEFKVNLLMLTD